jgi:mono/diheme cytochrome c family protein
VNAYPSIIAPRPPSPRQDLSAAPRHEGAAAAPSHLYVSTECSRNIRAPSQLSEMPSRRWKRAKLYEQRCASCHGKQGMGDRNPPRSLLPSPALLAMIQRPISVEGGKQFDTEMPAFKPSWRERTGRSSPICAPASAWTLRDHTPNSGGAPQQYPEQELRRLWPEPASRR